MIHFKIIFLILLLKYVKYLAIRGPFTIFHLLLTPTHNGSQDVLWPGNIILGTNQDKHITWPAHSGAIHFEGQKLLLSLFLLPYYSFIAHCSLKQWSRGVGGFGEYWGEQDWYWGTECLGMRTYIILRLHFGKPSQRNQPRKVRRSPELEQ